MDPQQSSSCPGPDENILDDLDEKSGILVPRISRMLQLEIREADPQPGPSGASGKRRKTGKRSREKEVKDSSSIVYEDEDEEDEEDDLPCPIKDVEEVGLIETTYVPTRPPNSDIPWIRRPRILGPCHLPANGQAQCSEDHRAVFSDFRGRRTNARADHFEHCLFDAENGWGRLYAQGEKSDCLSTVLLEVPEFLAEDFDRDIKAKIESHFIFTGQRAPPTTEREMVVELLMEGLTLDSWTLKCMRDIYIYGHSAVRRCRAVMFMTLPYYGPQRRCDTARQMIMAEDVYWRMLRRQLAATGDRRMHLLDRVAFYHYLLKTDTISHYPMC